MKYNVFVDFHHAGLLHSLIMLFEGRLGGTVYRPIGREWFDNGFWKVYDHPATVEQFLGVGGNTPDGTAPLNEVLNSYLNPKNATIVYNCHDIDSGQTNKAITLQGFMAIDFDIVIASLPAHVEPFKKLCELHPNKPKLIFQIGNAWTNEAAMAPNVMASAIIHGVPENINFISYHQEFDTKLFRPTIIDDENPPKNIYSFVNCFSSSDYFRPDWNIFTEVESKMTDWNFKAHGGQCRDGAVGPSEVLARTMQDARFIWHVKAGGDGYGHVIHNAFAVGRPPIVKKEYYTGKMAEQLMIDGVTCITIDGLNPDQIIEKILYYNDPVRYAQMSTTAFATFTRLVDFDQEQKNIELFLQKLV